MCENLIDAVVRVVEVMAVCMSKLLLEYQILVREAVRKFMQSGKSDTISRAKTVRAVLDGLRRGITKVSKSCVIRTA